MRCVDESLRIERQWSLLWRDLGGMDTLGEAQRSACRRREQQPGDAPRPEGGGECRTECLAQLSEAPVTEGTETDAVECVVGPQAIHEMRKRRVGLAVDVPAHVSPGRHQLVEGGDRLRAGNSRTSNFCVRHLLDPAVDPARSFQVVVVEGEQHAVACGVHIGLEIDVAEVDGSLEGWQGVLRGVAGPAAVGEGVYALPLEEGMPTQGQIDRPAAAQYSSFKSRL